MVSSKPEFKEIQVLLYKDAVMQVEPTQRAGGIPARAITEDLGGRDMVGLVWSRVNGRTSCARAALLSAFAEMTDVANDLRTRLRRCGAGSSDRASAVEGFRSGCG